MLAVKQQVPGVKQRLDSLNDLNRALLQNRYHKVLHVRAGNDTHHQKAFSRRPNMKSQFDGGKALVEAFRKLGVEYILSSPGTEWAPVWEAMADQIHRKKEGPKLLDVWHETLAVDIAAGYTLATGKMQAVLLHAGAGLLQGAMGMHGAFVAGVPMVVISGESMTYGEQPEFDPGAQWMNNLSIVGGTTSLVDTIVKYASVAGSAYTLYESVIRAGELAQRQPTGPVYLSVSTETLMAAWTPPTHPRTVPPAPRMLTAPEDIEKLAAQLAKAKRPLVLTEGAARKWKPTRLWWRCAKTS